MREILFRGKRVDNGEWVLGYYCPCVFGNFPAEPAIIDADELKNGRWAPVKVLPETVRQYTGLKDKNGKKIFEGDIVKYDIAYGIQYKNDDCCEKLNTFIETVKFENGEFFPIPKFSECEDYYYSYEYRNFEVIGNIYDNPELLESEE